MLACANVKWYLVQIPQWNKPWWLYSYNEDFWGNITGGRTPKSVKDKIFDAIVAEYEDLDHTKTGLVKKESKAGWLSRFGVWHPCDSMDHDNYAYYILKKTVGLLEKTGWVRVWYTNWTTGCRWHLSAEQRNWLLYNGHTVEDYD